MMKLHVHESNNSSCIFDSSSIPTLIPRTLLHSVLAVDEAIAHLKGGKAVMLGVRVMLPCGRAGKCALLRRVC